MRHKFVAGVLGLAAAMMITLPVSAHHRFCVNGDGYHDCNVTPDHFCAIARGVCDGAGYCMDDHSRGYCNQSCYVTQAPAVSQTPPQAADTPAPQTVQEVPAVQDSQVTQTPPAEQPQTYYRGGGHHGGHHGGGHHGCY